MERNTRRFYSKMLAPIPPPTADKVPWDKSLPPPPICRFLTTVLIGPGPAPLDLSPGGLGIVFPADPMVKHSPATFPSPHLHIYSESPIVGGMEIPSLSLNASRLELIPVFLCPSQYKLKPLLPTSSKEGPFIDYTVQIEADLADFAC